VLKILFKKLETAYTKWQDKQNRSPVITAEKNDLFEQSREVYSQGSKMIKANIHTTEADLVELEIPHHQGGAHGARQIVQTAPEFEIITSVHGQVTIQWREKGAKFPGKPKGVNHVKMLLAKLPKPPVSRSELTMEIIDTNNPHILKRGEEETGDMWYLAGCWVSTTGEEGPYSGIIRFVIP
jgi:hypothetical protein